MKVLTSEISNAANEAVKQPFTLNFGTSLETVRRQKPFTKKVKIPNVIKVIGNEMNSRIGFKVTLIRAKTKVTMIAVEKLSISKRFVSLPTVKIEKERIKNWRRTSSIIWLFS